MKDKFSTLEKQLRSFAEAKKSHVQTLAKLVGDKDFSSEYLARKRQEEEASWRNYSQTAYEKIGVAIHELMQAAQSQRSAWVNLESPKLTNALKLIELSGGKLEGETVRQITQSFAGDYPSLLALQKIYQAQGIAYDGGLSGLLYDLDSANRTLNDFAYASFVQGQSLNSFAGVISKIATKEGLEFPTMVEGDLASFARAGAGLPSQE